MRAHGAVAEWVDARPTRSFFASRDVPGTTSSVESALSRLARPDGPIQRVRQGLYWKKPPATVFGTARPDPTEAAFAAAGPGAGLAGASAANALGLSTQVPRQPTIAVVGRPPKGLHGVRLISRANSQRILLNHREVTVLEVLRDFPAHSELDWPDVRARILRLADEHDLDLDAVVKVAASERRAGLGARVADLVTT